MPRKTDGIAFELQPRPTKGDDGKPLLYAQPIITRKYTIDDLDKYCNKNRQTIKGDVKHFFDLLEDVASYLLSQGCRIETSFGSFAPKLKLLGDHTDPDKIQGRDVMYGGIEYIPSKKFVKASDCGKEGFRRVKSDVGNSQMYDSKAMAEALRKSVIYDHIVIKTFQHFSGLKYNSAKNYLDSLCQGENPRLSRYKEGHTWHYYFIKGT